MHNSLDSKIITIAILGVIAVSIGAFGAHGLRPILEPKLMHAFETGVAYHFYHLFAMAFCLFLFDKLQPQKIEIAYKFFFAGIILFSGSLYGMAIGKAAGIGLSFLGPITPIGGVCFILGWLYIALAVIKK
jgi:uncharacterized membrane protein YgdD (TMEM256/DUF423 family)